MKIKYLKLKSWLLVAMGSLLGLNVACEMTEEYACPEADYHVKGAVTNEQGEPIAGIGVGKVSDWDSESGTRVLTRYMDTTDAEGRYEVDYGYAFPEEPISIEFCDIDGAANGSYCDTLVEVKTEGLELTGGDGNWYNGEATVIQNVVMKKKTNK